MPGAPDSSVRSLLVEMPLLLVANLVPSSNPWAVRVQIQIFGGSEEDCKGSGFGVGGTPFFFHFSFSWLGRLINFPNRNQRGVAI